MVKMSIKTIPLTLQDNPLYWDDTKLKSIIDSNTIVGYLLSIKANDEMSMNLYLLPPNGLYEGSLESIKIDQTELRNAFLQWLETLSITPRSFQFRNPPLDLWLETRLNWINALCIKVHQKYGTDISDALSTAYMTILGLHKKGKVYIGNLHYLEIAIYTAIKKEHYYMRNRLTGCHPDAIHLDASPGDFSQSIENDVTDFHEIITAPDWETEEERRYNEIWNCMEEDLRLDFTEREIDQIKLSVLKGHLYLPSSLYRRLLAWRKTHSLEDYL